MVAGQSYWVKRMSFSVAPWLLMMIVLMPMWGAVSSAASSSEAKGG